MSMTINDAYDVLHVDPGANDTLIYTLLQALPSYIEVATGLKEEDQDDEPLVNVVSGFLLTLWYYSDHADGSALNRTINQLLKAITLKARTHNTQT